MTQEELISTVITEMMYVKYIRYCGPVFTQQEDQISYWRKDYFSQYDTILWERK